MLKNVKIFLDKFPEIYIISSKEKQETG